MGVQVLKVVGEGGADAEGGERGYRRSRQREKWAPGVIREVEV